jgi:hypothetical protein
LLGWLQCKSVPLVVFDTKGIPATRGERIVTAVEAGGKHVKDPYEAWITADPFRGGVRVLITGPHGFERAVQFAMDEDLIEITQRSGRRWTSEPCRLGSVKRADRVRAQIHFRSLGHPG